MVKIRSEIKSKKNLGNKLSQGFSLIEILIVIAIVGIFASLTFVSGHRIMQSQDQLAAISILKQSLARSATLANSKGQSLELSQLGANLILKDMSGVTVDKFDLPTQMSVNFPTLNFTQSGFIEPSSLAAISAPIILSGPKGNYQLTISLMAEMKAEVQ